MGKRSTGFERKERDFYPTPESAVIPLLRFLNEDYHKIYEPCAGDGALVDHLERGGQYVCGASDIEPRRRGIKKRDAFRLKLEDVEHASIIVTNPPWSFSDVFGIWCGANRFNLPCWFLLQADFAHNKQSVEMMKHCERMVSVGRVKWIVGSKYASKENVAWFLFNPLPVAQTTFYAREAV